ncbi:hypothetical protein [Bradyrhizobium sp. ERR14]|uniref:hypothetical protein n=1 Tax=Bradyrhizobium sp. ERR14 TaxID=2663837 RepID=UPI001618F4FE|nr:hypothetical protein [Bradyrhizobium sp. ERR14]MBB4391799.1 putative aspartyl protease [Bradyrhizobium sp. ERR14]
MVDTGADFTVLDLSFADPLAAMKIPLRLFEARSVVGSSKPLAVYRGTIVVTNGSRCISYETEFVVSDVRSGYYVVLGRDFLKHTTFTYNRARGIEYLTFG